MGAPSWNPLRILALAGGGFCAGLAAVLPAVFPPAVLISKPLAVAGAYLLGVATRTPGHTPE